MVAFLRIGGAKEWMGLGFIIWFTAKDSTAMALRPLWCSIS
jgi:hypothetical protein